MHAMNTLLSVCLVLLLSADHGSAAANWTEVTSTGATKQWWGITSSADGTKLAAIVYDGNIWTRFCCCVGSLDAQKFTFWFVQYGLLETRCKVRSSSHSAYIE